MKDWFGCDYAPDWDNSPFSGAPVCLGSPKARAWCLQELRRIVKEFKLDLLEHDQVVILDACDREGHGHLPGDRTDTSRVCALGYYEIYDKLRRENPNLLFENCVSGGRLVDFGVARRAHYICSNDSYDPLALRQAFYDASYPLPPSMIEGYLADYPGTTLANFKFMLRSAMLGWCTLMLDTTAWTPEQREAGKREFEIYKSKLRPLIAEANIYHILPRPNGKDWDGIQYFHNGMGKGVLFVFRPDSDEDTQTITFRGLVPDRKYIIQALDGSTPIQTLNGRKLMDAGVTIKLPERDSSDLIFIEQIR